MKFVYFGDDKNNHNFKTELQNENQVVSFNKIFTLVTCFSMSINASGSKKAKMAIKVIKEIKSAMALYHVMRDTIYVESTWFYDKVHDLANFGGYVAILMNLFERLCGKSHSVLPTNKKT